MREQKKNNFEKKKFERQFRQFRGFNSHQKELLETTLKGLSIIGELK